MRRAREVWFTFDDSPTFRGITDDTYWNGWLNVRVTPAVRDEIAAWLDRVEPGEQTQEDLRSAKLDVDGLVDLGNGYTAQEADAPRQSRVAKVRARRAGCPRKKEIT